jgi:hypothetical protein
MIRNAILALLALASPSIAAAEVLTWQCTFRTIDDEAAEPPPLTFRVDTTTQRAIMEGNIGFVDVQMHVGPDAFSFTERLGSGAVHTTTVTCDGFALHSRNTVIAGEFVPSQSMGRCEFDCPADAVLADTAAD